MSTNPVLVHATKMYHRFEKQMQEADTQFASVYGVPEGTPVYVGYWSRDFTDPSDPQNEGLPQASTQQRAVTFLNNTGCLQLLRRGGRDYPSVYRLVHPPTPVDAANEADSLTSMRPNKLVSLDNSVVALVNRVGQLEIDVEQLERLYAGLSEQIETFKKWASAPAE